MISYGKQSLDQEDIKAVLDVLNSDWLTQGPKVPEFEGAIKKLVTSDFAVAANSATSALHIACLALGVNTNDIVWTSPISFVASSNCALYCGANIDFVDIDVATGNLCVYELEKKLIHAKVTNKLPKVVIPVHLGGQSCDMEEIQRLSKQYGFYIIEDASHAIGGQYKSEPIGSCKYSDICIFSFHPVKIVTTAEGGIATTNNASLARKMQLFRSHGITADPSEMTEQSHGPWYYQQIELGFNYRMTDLQAALGVSQVSKTEQFVKKRNALANLYNSLLNKDKFIPLSQRNICYNAYHLYIIKIKNTTQENHHKLVSKLREKGIMGHVHYIPIHLQPYYKKLGFKIGDFPNAESYYQCAITLPLHPQLCETDIRYIVDVIHNII